VLLLVVLSMLTLFLLLGTTFLILASRARTTAGAFLRLAADQTTTTSAYTPFLREAALQTIRGTAHGSALRHHDLLGDRYGLRGSAEYGIEDGSPPTGSTRAAEPPALVAGDQVLRLRLRALNSNGGLGSETARGNLSGQVLTFLDGPEGIAYTSTRIITSLDANSNSSSVVFVERPRRLATAASLITGCADGVLEVRINDRDFAGAGLTGPSETDQFDSYQPNWWAGNPAGETNEGYDAVDEQNLAISGIAPDGVQRPSFHRSEFIDFWVRWSARADGHNSLPADYEQKLAEILRKAPGSLTSQELDKALRFRRATLRPFAFDHSPDGAVDFAGKPLSTSNPLDPIRTTALDVDADGDGELDSVWLDLGLTPITTPDRRLVKPLFAIRCIDLGGRLNLNAHGSPAHAIALKSSGSLLADSGGAPPVLRRGATFGPAGVRLDALDAVTRQPLFQRLVVGGGASFGKSQGIRRDISPHVGRYGGDTDGSGLPLAGQPRAAWIAWRDNPATAWIANDRGIPSDWTSGAGEISLFAGGPPDLWNQLGVGIDRRGHPAYLIPRYAGNDDAPAASDLGNTPYALDLLGPKAASWTAGQSSAAPWVDQPFAAPELEAVLRPFDPDNAAVLPQRLLTLDLSADAALRGNITTESWDTPAVIGGPPLTNGSLDDTTPGPSRLNFDHDLVRGLRMNLNRPFGNGADDDGDDIVDEPDERDVAVEGFLLSGSSFAQGSGITAWHLTRGLLPPALRPGGALAQPGREEPGLRARQLFAYHIFNLVDGIRDWAVDKQAAEAPGLWLCSGTWSTTSGSTAFKPRDPTLRDPSNPASTFALENHAKKVLAQWAVNVVDFMDADAIMTPFRYGRLPSEVVWGCEAPDLLITETLAFHDRGIADDPAHGQTAAASDPSWDQVRRPRGSLFLELHAVRSPTVPLPPRELYESDGTLDLGRKPPGTAANAAPIWRLSLTTARPTRTASNDIFKKILSNPDTARLEPDGATDSSIDGIGLDRYVWFTSETPSSASPAMPTAINTFCLESSAASVRIRRGDFLVVGPRSSTPVGGAGAPGNASPQTITLSQDQVGTTPAVKVTAFDGNLNPTISRPANASSGESLPPPGGQRKESRACWVSMPVPSQSGVRSGLNVSEQPVANYYPKPTGKNDVYTPPIDRPVTDSILVRELRQQGTFPNAATVFLERLADPTRPHEPDSTRPGWNPYMVVDFMPIDLTTFNGEAPGPEQAVVGGVTQDLRPDGKTFFHTRQRGMATDTKGLPLGGTFSLAGTLFGGDPPFAVNPWIPGYPTEISNPPGPEQYADPSVAAHFRYQLNGLNDNTDLMDDSKGTPDTCPIHTLGWTNISFGRRLGTTDGVPGSMVGAPSTPWPWIVWQDRPFSSEYELLFVPRTPPGRLLTDYRNPSIDPPRDPAAPALPARSQYDEFGVVPAAGHLMPFTAINDPPDADPPEPKRSRNADVLCRLFSYVRVPSPFAGTQRGLRPWTSSDPATDPLTPFLPPFNMLTTYREPGRVNINTIGTGTGGGEVVWNAILGGDNVPPAAPAWSVVQQAMKRQVLGTTVLQPWRVVTPQVAGTGTSAAASIPLLFNPPLGGTPTNDRQVSSDFSARSFTLLQTGMETAADGTPLPLFHPPRQTAEPLANGQYAYEERNTWFAYEPLIRAASNTTVRSEVYAIWVTMGFFEVEEATGTFPGTTVSMYPDGYKLLREHGSQTGDIRRHKAFYIYDRSIPVGYVPGEDLNVADGILVERLVE
jgi:hypothetical protein